MSVRLHILARWYDARAKRAHGRFVRFKAKAEAIWSRLRVGEADR